MKYIVFLFAFMAMALITTPGRAAVSVILECKSRASDTPNQHLLLEIDYSGYLRMHYVDDDGAPTLIEGRYPATDRTFPAQISDNTIKWHSAPPDLDYSLGRHSGTLTQVYYVPGGTTSTLQYDCHPYAPNRQKKF
jgi:hypothetical protein